MRQTILAQMKKGVAELRALWEQHKGTPTEWSHCVSHVETEHILDEMGNTELQLGELILFETRNVRCMRHVIAKGVQFPVIAHVVLFQWYETWGAEQMFHLLVELDVAPDVLSDPDAKHWDPTTAVKCAIMGGHREWLRVLLEYGCRLPWRLGHPEWVRELNEQVVERKRRCAAAVAQLLGIARFRRRADRDTLRMVAHQLKQTYRRDEWLPPK